MDSEASANSMLTALQDEREILNLLAQFDDAAIRNDLIAFRELWTEDAVWEIGVPIPMNAKGKDAIVQFLRTSKDYNEFFFRMTGRPVFMPHRDHTALRSTTVELAGRLGNLAYANVAFYEDEVVKTNGTWKFRLRSYRYLWVDTQSSLHGQTVLQEDRVLVGGRS